MALVTGAAQGIGRACALALAQAGADVALGLRDAAADQGLTAAVQALGRRALPLQMDVTYLDQITQAVAVTVAHFGRLDILVNNAGIGPSNAAESVQEADFDRTVAGDCRPLRPPIAPGYRLLPGPPSSHPPTARRFRRSFPS